MKVASWDLIAKANGKPTGDEIVKAREKERREFRLSVGMTGREYRKYLAVLRKAEELEK